MSSEVQVDIKNQSMGKVNLHGNNFINNQPYAIVLLFKIIKIINSNFWRKSYMCASFPFFLELVSNDYAQVTPISVAKDRIKGHV